MNGQKVFERGSGRNAGHERVEDQVKDVEGLGRKKVEELQIGDRVTWKYAPDWWNPAGEMVREIGEGWVKVDYVAYAISVDLVILISR